ncbi:hypothetical protein TIFTF001_022007 [Ficus carica]|uniref:Uncharacterized protein n=1 Tax=Ficus carica TaxID=3494 RepID=A0AA88AHV2_FICCA|nr:hypothetical protein TIFTF001_022007 [Ficus carica]
MENKLKYFKNPLHHYYIAATVVPPSQPHRRQSHVIHYPNRFLASTPSAWGSLPPVINSKPHARWKNGRRSHPPPPPPRSGARHPLSLLCYPARATDCPPGDLADGDPAQHSREPAQNQADAVKTNQCAEISEFHAKFPEFLAEILEFVATVNVAGESKRNDLPPPVTCTSSFAGPVNWRKMKNGWFFFF